MPAPAAGCLASLLSLFLPTADCQLPTAHFPRIPHAPPTPPRRQCAPPRWPAPQSALRLRVSSRLALDPLDRARCERRRALVHHHGPAVRVAEPVVAAGGGGTEHPRCGDDPAGQVPADDERGGAAGGGVAVDGKQLP